MAGKQLMKRENETALTVKALLEKNQDALARALPKHVSVERIMRVAIGAIAQTPALQECTPQSLFSAIVQSATLGLEPSGPLGEAYLVPFYNNKRGTREVQFIPGYRGLINLARRSGDVTLFYADVICENDKYKIRRGSDPVLEHEIELGDRGDPVAYYAVFKTKEGDSDFEVMTPDEVDGIRRRSKASDRGPWKTDFEEMAKKTVIRRLAKRAPMSVELAKAVDADNRAAMGDDPDYGDVVELTGVRVEDAAPQASPFEVQPVAPTQLPPAPAPAPAPASPPKRKRGRPPKAKPAEAPAPTPPVEEPELPAEPPAPEGPPPEAAPEPPVEEELPGLPMGDGNAGNPKVDKVIEALTENGITVEEAEAHLRQMTWLDAGQALQTLDPEKLETMSQNMDDFVSLLKRNKGG